MRDKTSDILKMESKELAEELELVGKDDKELIIASLKGMLLVANVNKKNKEIGKVGVLN